jgi:hypothetical protein
MPYVLQLFVHKTATKHHTNPPSKLLLFVAVSFVLAGVAGNMEQV